MRKETKDHYSFIPTDKDRTLNWIEEKYGKYRVASTENNVEKYYKFNNGSFIKTYKDTCEKGEKSRNGKI